VWVVLALLGVGAALGVSVHALTGSGAPTTSCADTGTSAPMTGHQPEWPRIDAPTGPGPAGVTVLAWSATPLLRVDVGTGAVSRPVSCTGEVDGVFPVAVPWARVMNIAQAGDGRVWWVDRSNHLRELAGDEASGAGTTAYPPAGAYAVPGRDGALLVVARTVSGQRLLRYTDPGPPISILPLDERDRLVGEVTQGLVVRHRDGNATGSSGERLLVLDPRTGKAIRPLGPAGDDVPAVRGDRLAWVVSFPCRSRCTLRVADLAARTARDVVIPGTSDPGTISKAFSPDGSTIALSYTDIITGSGLPHAGAVLTVSAADGSTARVVGMSTTGNGYPLGVTWSVDGRWLVLSASNTAFGRFAVWDTASHELRAMPWAVAQDISPDFLSTVGGPLGAWD
jgi:hypothetical protein